MERELYAYLDCGILARGFARVRCPGCGFERLVAFSCKGSICPSCAARRMEDTAAYLVENVFQEVPVRQWVLSLPRRMRFLAACHPKVASRLLDLFTRAVFSWLRRAARRQGVKDPRAGAVTVVQRFGGSLNLNVHFHTLVPDGVFDLSADPVCFDTPGYEYTRTIEAGSNVSVAMQPGRPWRSSGSLDLRTEGSSTG